MADTWDVLARYRRNALVAAYVLLVPWYLAAGHHHTALDVLLDIAIGVDVLIWCLLDARFHDKSFEHAFVLPFLATWPISLAIYLVWTRRAAGLVSYLLALLLAMGVLIVAVLIMACLSMI